MADCHDRLIDTRKNLGISVTEIAKKFGVAGPDWYNYESGHRTPRGRREVQIANNLGFPVDFFCEAVRVTRNFKGLR
ncbi:hypothetical protein J22TS1_43350 [Siminovitchia terrae]|uniref:helix-turn-helix domain-containing protein n=1 Tax=Siminovitchia terrae TaxID=1914933 RepID=UPI001B0F6F1F|nr:helix-turn-helix transcriptional regulator [Siminovitchia terrae]GIN93284.1 hypothetical protein J22TS1_43350 [Siminovitchia terrae]